MRRRLLYHEAKGTERTISDYEIHIETFEYDPIKYTDKESIPRVVYYYIPIYNDDTTGDKVYNTDSNNEAIAEFELVRTDYSDVKLDTSTGIITCGEWNPNETGSSGQHRDLAIVKLTAKIKRPNTTAQYREDYSTTTAQQASRNITWDKPVVELSYDTALAQPEEEGGKITLMPTVKWTQQGTDGDGNSVTPNSDENANATYVFTLLDGESNIESLDTNTGELVIKNSTLEEEHWIAKVEVEVTYMQQSGTDNCDIYQEAYTVVPDDTNLGVDVLLFDKDTRDNIIVPKGDFDYSKYPKSQYTPIGLVVIPREHGVYGDNNTIGVLSLMDADLSSPAEGGTHGNTIYGMSGQEINTVLIPYNVKDSVINENVVGSNMEWDGFANMPVILFPSDMYSGLANTLDKETSYNDSAVANGFASPYNNNGGLNSLYIADADDGGDKYPSVFQDFDGEQKSIDLLHSYNYQVDGDLAHLYGTVKDDSVWRTSSKISFVDNDDYNTSYVENYSVLPAMEACWRYSPENTHEGNWHLPSAGEWGYVVARAKSINDTLATLKELYGINYSDIGDYGYINTTLEMESLMGGEYNAATGNFDGGFKAISTNKKGVARPMMRLKATVSSGNIGNTPLPTGYDDIEANNFLDDNRHKSRWCIYRNENACNDEYYPSYDASSNTNCKTGTIYGVLVKSDTDMTILKTDVELFSFDNLTCASGKLNRQFGYYNEDIEAGWYVIQKIEWSDGTTTSNIYAPNVVVGNKLQAVAPASDGWQGTISVIYNYRNESSLGYDDYTNNAANSVLSPFRIGYWDHSTAILLHSTQDTTNTAPSVYNGDGGGYGTTYGVDMIVPAKTIGSSDDSIYELENGYIVAVGEPMILEDGETVTINHSGNVNSSYSVSGASSIQLMMHEMNTTRTNTPLANTTSGDIANLFSNGNIEYTAQSSGMFEALDGYDKSKSRYRLFLLITSSVDFTISNGCTIHMTKK